MVLAQYFDGAFLLHYYAYIAAYSVFMHSSLFYC